VAVKPGSIDPSPAQGERDQHARVVLARSCGLALLAISAGLETGTIVQPGAGPETLVRVAFAARARRLLRAAYLLLDNDGGPEAVGLLRTMSEYLFVSRWLSRDTAKRMSLWVEDDLRRAIFTNDKTFELGGFKLMDDAMRGTYVAARENLLQERKSEPKEEGEKCDSCGRVSRPKKEVLPTIEQMAADVGLEFAYNTQYRLDSQGSVHATPTAVNFAYEPVEAGSMVRAVPAHALAGIDSYALAAHILLDLLVDTGKDIPELGWMPHLEVVSDTLTRIRKADSDTRRTLEVPASPSA
jgi:hypothetical protein